MSSVDGSRFVDGTNVKTGELIAFFTSSLIFAWANGAMEIALAFMDAPATIAFRFITWAISTLSLVFTEPTRALAAGWAEAAAWASGLGLFAFIAGVAVIVTFFPFLEWLLGKWRTMLVDL